MSGARPTGGAWTGRGIGHYRSMESRLPTTSRIGLAGYVIAAAANLTAIGVGAHPWDTVSKALLMPLLIGVLWTALPRPVGTGDKLVAAALVFSWLGDLALEPSGDLWFYLGLAMFAVAQICYLFGFNGTQGRRRRLSRWIAAPFAAWWLVLVILVAPKMGVLTIAVAIYGMLLLGMAATSWRVSVLSGIGGLFFAVSDSLIALTSLAKVLHFSHSDAVIMATYIVGQALLVLGWILSHHTAPKAGAPA